MSNRSMIHGINRRCQKGMTLIEMLVAGMISIIAMSAMVVVMANTVGTSSQSIQMARVSNEMRAAMQIMTRELRRANYHSTFMACYGDVDCRGSGSLNIENRVSEIGINVAEDCMWFWYDRPGNADLVSAERIAAFRRTTETVDGNPVGKLQMTTTFDDTTAVCPTDEWADLTDVNQVNITGFTIENDMAGFASYTELINADNATQSVERIRVTMTARITSDASLPGWLQTRADAERTLQNFIRVRNNVTAPAVVVVP